MPVINSKGLVTDELLFEDDFEDGNLTEWSIVSSGAWATTTSSPAQGSFSLRLLNAIDDGGGGNSTCSRTINLSSKPRTIQFKFYIIDFSADDVPVVIMSGNGGNALFFRPNRQTTVDAAQRMNVFGNFYTTLNAGEWYTFTATLNFNTQLLDFELRDGVDALESSDTGIAIGATTLDTITFVNQQGATPTIGEIVYDDIKIWGKGI